MPCLLYVVRQALAQLFFFRVSFAFFLSFFLSFVLSFFLSLLGAQLSSGLSFFGLFREPRPGPGGPRVCSGDASCVSSSPRLRVVALFFLLSFLAPFLVSFLLCLFLFFALRLPRRRAGWLRSRQDSFCRGPSLGLFLFLKALFLRLFFGPLSGFCSLHSGALTVCCFFCVFPRPPPLERRGFRGLASVPARLAPGVASVPLPLATL